MAQVLVRHVEAKTVEALKRRARRHRRSLQEELKGILEEAGGEAQLDRVTMARRIQAVLLKKGIDFGDSAREQREGRRR